jgi:hypothetical protein
MLNRVPRHEDVSITQLSVTPYGLTGGEEVQFHAFLIVDGGKWLASRPGRFAPGERTCRYPLCRRLGGTMPVVQAVG